MCSQLESVIWFENCCLDEFFNEPNEKDDEHNPMPIAVEEWTWASVVGSVEMLTCDNTVSEYEVPEAVGPRSGYQTAGEQSSTQQSDLPVSKAVQENAIEETQSHSQRWVQIHDESRVERRQIQIPEFVLEDETEWCYDGNDKHLLG
jgi:hypothetical protein